ncbi:unnamed protein product, partial [Porites evermanni]
MSLQLFDVPDVDYRYEASREVEFQPALTGIQPITFSIPGSDDYYDTNSIRFKVKVRLTDPAAGYNGLSADLTAASDANNSKSTYCVNNFGHSIFRDITLSMNGVLMTEQSNTYHYRAYLETLLNYNREEGATKLAPQGWVNALNVVNIMGATGANSDIPTNAGWSGNTELRALTSRLLSENWHTFLIRPHLPPLRTGKLLVPNIQMDFELFLNPNTVYMMGTPNKGTLVAKKFPAIHPEDIKVTLLMRKVTLNASVYVRLQKERQLGKQIARYPVVRSEIRTFSFDGRTTQWEQDNVFVGRFPDRVMVGLLHSDAFNGNLQRYPFAFEKFGVTQIRQTLNGEEYPYRTLQLTGDQAYEDLLGYDRFLQAMGAYNEDKIPMLLPGDWGQGKNCTLFLFNNVPSGKADDPQYRNPRQSGNTRLIIDFAAAVGHNITVLVWSEGHGSLSTSPSTVGRMIRQPSSVIIAGPSGSGKSELVEQWLRDLNVFQVKPKKIVYAYDRWQPRFERMQKKEGIQFHRGLPDPRHLTQWFGRTRGGVLVLDDLMEEGGQDKRVLDLFTKDSHHRNITVLYLTQDLFPPGKFAKTINRNAHYIVAFKNPRDQTGIRTILLQAFPERWRQVLRLFKRITSRPFGYLMLDVHPASDDRYRLWSHLTRREGKAQLQRELARVRRQREGGQQRDLSERMDTPTFSPAGVGSPTSPSVLRDLSSMTDMVAELTQPVDRAQLDQEIEDFQLTYPVNVDDALNAFTLPPVAGTGTTTTTAPPPPPTITTAPTTTATQTRTRTTTSTVTTPTGRPTVAAKQPRRRPRVPSPPSPGSSPPSEDEDEDDDDDDRGRGLRRRLDLLNEDAQERARGRRIRNITHTNTVTTVYEEGGRPSVRRTSTRTSGPP